MIDDPILITGAARSGTSLIAGVFHRCGAFGGNVLGPTPHNKRGQYENLTIVREIVKPYLLLQGYDPLGQKPLPDVRRLLPFDNLRARVQSVIKAQGYERGPWYYKGAKMCLLWPEFAKAFPKAKWIIVRRDEQEIVSSCLRTGFMRKRRDAVDWMRWVYAHKQRFSEMHAAGLDVREVWPRHLFVGDFLEIKEAITWAGLDWNGNEVLDFIEPALWHGGK